MTTERRIQSLDILRVIAVSAVLLNHGIFSSRLYQLANRYDIAELAVEVFFVLSGYLITNLLIHKQRAPYANIGISTSGAASALCHLIS